MANQLKVYEYYEFVRWIATPEPLRDPSTQKEFGERYRVAHGTIANWKQDPNFWEDVQRVVDDWSREKHTNVVASIYVSAVKDRNPYSQKLWLDHIARIKEATAAVNGTGADRGGQEESWAEMMTRLHNEKKAKALEAERNKNANPDTDNQLTSGTKSN